MLSKPKCFKILCVLNFNLFIFLTSTAWSIGLNLQIVVSDLWLHFWVNKFFVWEFLLLSEIHLGDHHFFFLSFSWDPGVKSWLYVLCFCWFGGFFWLCVFLGVVCFGWGLFWFVLIYWLRIDVYLAWSEPALVDLYLLRSCPSLFFTNSLNFILAWFSVTSPWLIVLHYFNIHLWFWSPADSIIFELLYFIAVTNFLD